MIPASGPRSLYLAGMNSDRTWDSQPASRLKLLEEELTREIIGAFYDVYNALGFGFLETIYKPSMETALVKRHLSVDREFPIEVLRRTTDRLSPHRHVRQPARGRRSEGDAQAVVRRQASAHELSHRDEARG